MYALISSFERDLRDVLDQFVVGTIGEEAALGEFADEAGVRRARDGAFGDSLLEWLDLRPEYELLNRHRELLPRGLAREIRELTSEVNVIEPIRHTVMHGRPLKPQDPERLFTALSKFNQPHWSQLKQAVTALNADDSWTPEDVLPEGYQDRVRHNLPLPDYDETGVLGREDEIDLVSTALKRRRDAVITLTGEGGIGKSALALEIAYRLLDDSESPFEMVLWVSLKTERLTAYGVEKVRNKIESLTGATAFLGRAALDTSFTGGLADLSAAIGDLETLIVFDNLETISGDDFVRLYEALPASVAYLVTSRLGIGQLERRYPVGPLSLDDGMQLLNQLIRNRRVERLRGISSETRKELVERLRSSPLAIRWYVLSVEAGRDPLESIRNQNELIAYCVASVYGQISENARLCLRAMRLIDRAVLVDDLVILTELSVSEVHSAVQELIRGSLVEHSTSDDLRTVIQISESAGIYVDTTHEPNDLFAESVQRIEQELTEFEERRQAEHSQRSLAPIVVRTREAADRPVAFILREALLASQQRQFDEAIEQVEKAKALNPEYWEVWRVEAFIQSANNNPIANSRYREAYALAVTDEEKAVVAHFFSGHLARNEHDLEEAVTFAQEAHEKLKQTDTARALGNLLIWQEDFDAGLELLHTGVSSVERRGKPYLILSTAIADGYRRKAEYALAQESNPKDAWQACWVGWSLGLRELDQGISDARLLDAVIDTATFALKSARVAEENGIQLDAVGPLLAELVERMPRFTQRGQRLKYLAGELGQCERRSLHGSLAGKVLESMASESRATAGQSGSLVEDGVQWESGEILSINRNGDYGFIRSDSYPKNVFFHRNSVAGAHRVRDFAAGDPVEFVSEQDELGRDRAQGVRPKAVEVVLHKAEEREARSFPDPELDEESKVAYVSGRTSLNYGFAWTVESTPRNVLIHESIFPESHPYSSVDIGDRLIIEEVHSEDQEMWRAAAISEVVPLREQ